MKFVPYNGEERFGNYDLFEMCEGVCFLVDCCRPISFTRIRLSDLEFHNIRQKGLMNL